MKSITLLSVMCVSACLFVHAANEPDTARFSPETDLLSLHYDHAPDKDDGHSAAADRTILQSLYGTSWITHHVVAVSGAYGRNADRFNPASDAVMDIAWNDCDGWLDANADHGDAVTSLLSRWRQTLQAGGDVWVKEGGQSDITAEVIQLLQKEMPDLDPTRRIHVVQHSNWNEDQTTEAALSYTKQHTDYIRIPDANAYLNIKGGEATFVEAATNHPEFGAVWMAAFAYYDPKERLDFSDTGELMFILGLGEINCEQFKQRFLANNKSSKAEPR